MLSRGWLVAAPLLFRFICCDAVDIGGADDLPRYRGSRPPWPYRGFKSFPAFFFSANESGLEDVARLELAAQHQVVGWGWQQSHQRVGPNDGRYYQEEVYLAQMASRFAAFLQFAPSGSHKRRQTQAVFVYRHMEVAEFYFQTSAAAYHDPGNKDMFLHDASGRVCWNTFDNTGPYWNFSSPRTAEWFIKEIAAELVREADIQTVFFDETDYLYCGGPAGNCSKTMLDSATWAEQYRAKIQLMRQLTLKLNAAGIWPIFSSYNGFSDTPYRDCVLPFDEYYIALHDVGWFRFYEWGFGATGPDPAWYSQAQLKQALRESTLGLPVIVHPYPTAPPKSGGSQITLPLALFLLAQNEYWYFGASTGWVEKDWHWWSEYDSRYGRPVGPASLSNRGGRMVWSREFEACSVSVTEDLKDASIVFHNGTVLVV